MENELAELVCLFLEETRWERTSFTEDHVVPSERQPRFDEFISWLLARTRA